MRYWIFILTFLAAPVIADAGLFHRRNGAIHTHAYATMPAYQAPRPMAPAPDLNRYPWNPFRPVPPIYRSPVPYYFAPPRAGAPACVGGGCRR